MKRSAYIHLLLAALIVAIAVIAAHTLTETPHSFTEAQCRDCHVDPDRDPGRLTKPITKLCAGCHQRTIRASSHPVDIFPVASKIPQDMPLRNGKITCVTCHNVHGDSRLVFGIRSYFLRRPTADMKFFCVTCHPEDRTRPGHRELVTVAHIGGRYAVTDPEALLDPLSIECVSCHDGSIGQSARYSLGEGVWRHEDGMFHPVGTHYNTARMKSGSLAPASQLDRRLRFFAGKIGCGTCHDMYSSIAGRLVMSNDDSRLCTACHFDK